MQVRQVLVFITGTSGRPTLIPPEVASRMRRFVLEPTELPPMRTRKRKKRDQSSRRKCKTG